MRIEQGYPPNYEAIQVAFNLTTDEVCFAYGTTLYNPSGNPVSAALMKHEEVHARQQREYGSVEEWWLRYIKDKEFRVSQEIPAYRAQYEEGIKSLKTPAERLMLARDLAADLSGPLYGNSIHFATALKAIRI